MDQSLSLPWLLLATPQLLDPNFKKTVVLIVENTAKGSLGFVLNRPVQTSLADIVTAPNVEVPDNVPVWYGGPVERASGIILQDRTEAERRGAGQPVSLSLSSSETALTDLVDHSRRRISELKAPASKGPAPDGLYPFRFLVGHSGWGPGQLVGELRAGAWIQAQATWRLLFNTNWKLLWDEALGTIGASPKTLAPAVHQYLN
jgi:putative transcriptional regulator